MTILVLILILLGVPALLVLGWAVGFFPTFWWMESALDFFTNGRHSRTTLMIAAVVVLFIIVFVISVLVLT